MSNFVSLLRNSNQASGIGHFAIDFLNKSQGSGPSDAVLEKTKQFHTDAVLCGLSALALGTNAPNILQQEALEYADPNGATIFGNDQRVKTEKAVVANCSAVREWDSNGTNFGYNPALGHIAGEFGHNDFYGVPVAACQATGKSGEQALLGMVLLDEIRGRLAEVFSLKTYKIDHVVHGAIGSAATYGALCGASAEQIEHAIGMVVAHFIPWRAIRAGKQLSDSKGASAAISAEVGVLSMKRAMRGFIGPKDIFRNPESLFRQFEPTNGDSPFDLMLSHSGDDFAVMGMHFKLGLYEHQSAGALQGLINLVTQNPDILQPEAIQKITITAYEPAFGIIGDPAKRDPKTRQSADHSMVYIVSTMLRKALENPTAVASKGNTEAWKALMLSPYDYSDQAIHNPLTRQLMDKIEFKHGGPDYDAKYPDGIPTSMTIKIANGQEHDSGLVMYPAGHARYPGSDMKAILDYKFELLGGLSVSNQADLKTLIEKLSNIEKLSSADLLSIYSCPIAKDKQPV